MEIPKAAPVPVFNTSSLIKFNVRRSLPVLVPPAKPTPREFKRLSDLDNEESLLLMVPGVFFYPPTSNPSMAGKDPAKIIKQALSNALVYYYPLAGTVREWPADSSPKRVVECTGQGAVFIEADADVTLAQLGDTLHPPYPYLDDIMYVVPGMGGALDCPILHFQITRLKCGGVIMAFRYHASIMDGTGLGQFLTAVGELARGASQPSILPVWDRDRLFARRPPRITCIHPEFEEDCEPLLIPNMAYRIFYFTRREIAALRNLVPLNLRKSTSFELITAVLWRCRTAALQLDPEEEVRMIFAVNARDRYDPPLPKGFYGNAFAFAGTVTTAGELLNNMLGYAVELVSKVKEKVTEEYMRSFTDGLAMREWRLPMALSSFFTSDLRKMGYLDVDFGWGTCTTAGPGVGWYEPYPHEETNYVLCKSKGEHITVVPMILPADVMELFEQEIYSILNIRGIDPFTNANEASSTSTSTNVIKSNL